MRLRFKRFSFRRLSKKKKVAVVIVVLALIGVGAYVLGIKDKLTEPPKPPEPVYSQLTGIEVTSEVAARPILGVMIENSIFARPQTGVDSAGIVFESVTEGGITRYLTMFQETVPQELGPIRSVRPYFVDWIMGFDGSVAHVGGSAEALSMLSSRNAKTLSQFKYPNVYRRITSREAPHNVYATPKALQDLQTELGHKTSVVKGFPRSNDTPSQTPTAVKIAINYSGPDYAVEFRYDATSNGYKRFLAGQPDRDAATKKQITSKNLVVLKMSGSKVNAIGSGSATVFKDSIAIKGRWKQTSFRERLTLTDEQGNEIPLNRGETWFAVVPSVGSFTY